MSNETPAEVLADIEKSMTAVAPGELPGRWRQDAKAHRENGMIPGFVAGLDWCANELERSLAAGKVATHAVFARSDEYPEPVCLTGYVGTESEIASKVMEMARREGYRGTFADRMKELGWWVAPLFTAPPADPAKASEPDLHAHLLDMLGVKAHEEAGAEIGRLHGIALGKASVRIDFPGIGHAGPFEVKDGDVTLPDATMSDLAHHFRMGYVAKASGSAPEGEDGDSLSAMVEDWESEVRAELSLPESEIDHLRCGERIHDIERMKRYMASIATPPASPVAEKPAYWEWRFFNGHPHTVDFGNWSEWERVIPRGCASLEDRLNELREYISSGKKYQLRALFGRLMCHSVAAELDGPAAYCRDCQAVGMSNCSEFDKCSGATCVTCHRPLNAATPPASAPEVTEEMKLRACVAYYDEPAWKFMSHKEGCLDRMGRALTAALQEKANAR